MDICPEHFTHLAECGCEHCCLRLLSPEELLRAGWKSRDLAGDSGLLIMEPWKHGSTEPWNHDPNRQPSPSTSVCNQARRSQPRCWLSPVGRAPIRKRLRLIATPPANPGRADPHAPPHARRPPVSTGLAPEWAAHRCASAQVSVPRK